MKRVVALILTAFGACCLAFGQDNAILAPNVLNLVVGETHSIQALNPAGQPVMGLTWTSSEPNVVSLSTDDPPVLSALAVGHVTITAGTATADVTVSAGALPLGTVIWSNPGNGSGVWSIMPAVPSPSGVADVFAFQDDNTVSAITSDGITAWNVDLSYASVVPDFQGGLVGETYLPDGTSSIIKFDGITGARSVLLSADENSGGILGSFGVHPDGTIFTILSSDGQASVVGLDPTTGAQKFSAPLAATSVQAYGIIVAGDGYAYVPYGYSDPTSADSQTNHLMLLRVDSSGGSSNISVNEWTTPLLDFMTIGSLYMITNADQGILIGWDDYTEGVGPHMALVNGGGASLISPGVNNNSDPPVPVLQAWDGSFVGTVEDADTGVPSMIAFDQSGNVRWSVANEQPLAVTADGGVIAQSGTVYGSDGGATGQVNVPMYSWTSHAYRLGSTDQVAAAVPNIGLSWAAMVGLNMYGAAAAHFPVDFKSNYKVTDILSQATWQKFANSTCRAVLGNPQGMPAMIANYDSSLQMIKKKQSMTNFYDIGNPGVGSLMLRTVTGGEIPNNVMLTDYLGTANAATANMGYSRQTAVVLRVDFFSQSRPEFTLLHEVLFHAYAGLPDDAIFANAYFQQQGLWRPVDSTATTNISAWMSTDCTCTPGKPGTTCQASTAGW